MAMMPEYEAQTRIRLASALGAVRTIAEESIHDHLYGSEIDPKDMELVMSDVPWGRKHRIPVIQTMEKLIHGSLEAVDLPKFEVPSEYIAAVIASVCAPTNFQVACRWIERGISHSASAIEDGSMEPIKAAQLFVLVIDHYGAEPTAKARANLEVRLRELAGRAREDQATKNKEGL